MNRHNIILLIFSLLFLILFYLCYENKKESFEGIAGTSFVSRVPKGTIVAYYPPGRVVTNIPVGWAICNGEKETPDLRGKFILGYNPSTLPDPPRIVNNFNDVGGEENHTLSVPEMPSHTHALSNGTQLLISQSGEAKKWIAGSTYERALSDDVSLNNTGGSQPHNNMPPYRVLIYIMKL